MRLLDHVLQVIDSFEAMNLNMNSPTIFAMDELFMKVMIFAQFYEIL